MSKTLTVEQLAAATGLHPLGVVALDPLLTPFRRRGRYEREGALFAVRVANGLADAVQAGALTKDAAAKVLARTLGT
jgi:hypothetical protein